MITDKAKQFIQCLICSREYGFDDFSVLTHAWHESDGFQRIIGGWNCWGIKKPEHSTWSGKIFVEWTHEYMKIIPGEVLEQTLARARLNFGGDANLKDGQRNGMWYVLCTQDFIDWATCEEAVLWYCDLIERLYKRSFEFRASPIEFFANLQNGIVVNNKPLQYTNDPTYFYHLITLYRDLMQNQEVVQAIQNIR